MVVHAVYRVQLRYMNIFRKTNFRKRFNEYYPYLCKIANEYVKIADVAEDIVQETFIAVWNRQKDSLPEKEFALYMARAVRNNCISYIKNQDNVTISFEDILDKDKFFSITEDEMTENTTHNNFIARILSDLPPKCRQIFLMSRMEGLHYREIAEELGISEKTVENQIAKALRILRKNLYE